MRERLSRFSSSSGKRRTNRRLPAQTPSDSASGLFARIRNFWHWLLAQRFHYAAVLFVICWFLLWFRAFQVQVVLGPVYKEMADEQHSYTETIEGERGYILDRNGHILARSVSCQSVYANPRIMQDLKQDINDAAKRLAPILKRNASDLVALFGKNRSFIWLERKVDDATAAAIEKEAIPGIGLSRESQRVYPYRHLAGQLLGFVGLDNHGLEGVELAYDKTLCGTSSKSRLPHNAAERLLSGQQVSREDQRGEDLSLTIDIQIQFIAEDVLQKAVQTYKAKWGGVLVADSQSGEILAWAQYPFFNPNNYRESNFDLYRNRLAGDSMEPGSTFKPFLMASALQENIVNPSTVLFCENGVWRTKYANIRDDTHAFGNLTATEIISHSSNIGVAKISLQLGAQKFHSYLSRLNFGQRTGIGIHEAKGILRRPRDWSELDLMSSAFGQSVSVTGVQMLQAYSVLANGGEFHPLRLVRDKEGFSSDVTHVQRIFSKKTTRDVLKMMEEVVDGGGTGSRARIPGVRVAGKTGTAQKAAKNNKGYSNKRLASFGGIVPADAPRYVIYVMIDEPSTTSYASVVSAPVFQQVAARTLAYSGYLPDVVFDQAHGERKPSVNPVQRKKDEIYLANLAKYRAAQAKKAQERQKEKAASGIMPDIVGMSLRRAMETCATFGLIPSIAGEGSFIVKQDPAPGKSLGEESSCTVWLSDDLPSVETLTKE